jgi:hypothetical protein
LSQICRKKDVFWAARPEDGASRRHEPAIGACGPAFMEKGATIYFHSMNWVIAERQVGSVKRSIPQSR